MNQPKNQTTFISLLIIFILAFYYFAIIPKNRQLKQLNTDLAAKKIQSDALDARVTSLTQINTQYAVKKRDFDKLKIALPAEARPDEIFLMLQSMATLAGVSINDIQTKEANNSDHSVGVSVTILGEFGNITKFTDLLEKNLRPVAVNNLSLVAGEKKDSGSVNLSATLDLDFFVSQKPTTAAEKQQGTTNQSTKKETK